MKRDFSDSTREQLINIIDNDRAYLYNYDINGETFFACYEATGDDYSPFYDEIEGIVAQAGTDYAFTDERVDKLIEEINTVFDAAQAKDGECARTAETDIHLTVTNLIGDLETLVYALDVKKPGSMDVNDLESLDAGDMGCIFGDPVEFEDRLEFVDNPLYEDFMSQFVKADGTWDYDAINSFVEENEDQLSMWELQVFATILNSYIDPETGKLDDEGIEQFMEAFYIPQPDLPGQDYIVYDLGDEYTEVAAYYDAYVNTLLQSYDGDVLSEDNVDAGFYSGASNLNGLLAGLNLFGQQLVIEDVYGPDPLGGSPVLQPNEVNIDITSDGSWLHIDVENVLNVETINVSHFGPITESLIEGEIHSLEDEYVDPEDAYSQALSEGFDDYLQSQVTSPITDLIPDSIDGALEIAEIFTDAEEAREDQVQENAENQAQINWLTYLQLCGNASGDNVPCNGTVITCGGESAAINQQINVSGLTQAVEEYNSTAPEGQQVKPEEVINAVYDPSTMDYDHLQPYFDGGNESVLQEDNNSALQ